METFSIDSIPTNYNQMVGNESISPPVSSTQSKIHQTLKYISTKINQRFNSSHFFKDEIDNLLI